MTLAGRGAPRATKSRQSGMVQISGNILPDHCEKNRTWFSQWFVVITLAMPCCYDIRGDHCEKNVRASPDFSQRGRAAVKAIEKRSSFCREWLPKNTTPTERNSDGNFSTDVCPVRRWRFRRL